MIVYTVSAAVREDLVESYESYMIGRHIPDVMATGLFVGATIARGEPGRYRVDYRLADRASFDRYIAAYSAELRDHFNQHLPEGVELSRSMWETAATYAANGDRVG